MTERTTPPFRADHVGSLLRPATLRAAREARAAGRIDAAELAAVEDQAVLDAIAMQEEVGLKSASDGEFRRTTWHMDFIYQLGGIHQTSGKIPISFRNATEAIDFETAAIAVTEPVHLPQPIFADAFTFLREHVAAGVTPKLTIPSPSMVHYRGGTAAIDRSVYPEIEGFWADLVGAYRAEVAALGELGCHYLQFDDTSLAYLNDPAQREFMAAQGGDPLHQHETYIGHLNEVIADRPAGMAVTTHLCRGNFRSSWAAEGGYDFVAEVLFSELAVDGFFLEYDDERSGGFEPLRFVPPGKTVVLGLVTTKSGALEEPAAVRARVLEAAKYVPLEQLCLSPQCGFSSTIEGNVLSYEEEVAKLQLIVGVAHDLWGEA
ncbi:MAG TPA: 5-methyltetrahydropteroyltriglutamate--homocysteine S-methyltransferase [Acidimicrobiales bacterium]|nr:5-methyltetrahydropteroyltriglutamate--homocysteine S-methyltransferase [Acidimicrobiales bacterium]